MFRANLPKPNNALKKLKTLFSKKNGGMNIWLDKDRRLDFNFCGEHSSFFLEAGIISLYNKDDDKLLISINHPFCIGLTRIFHNDSRYYMKSETDVRIMAMSNKQFTAGLDKYNLWKESFEVISYVIDVYESIHISNIVNANAYIIIKKSLEEVWCLPEDIRSSTSIFKYVMDRHPISRSSVTKIISALNEGGYIETKRGIVKNIKKIPSKY